MQLLCVGAIWPPGDAEQRFPNWGGGPPNETGCYDRMDVGLQQMALILLLTTIKTPQRKAV